MLPIGLQEIYGAPKRAPSSLLCSALTFENDGVASEDFELIHLGLSHLDNGIVVLLRVLNLELMGRLLAVHNRR